MVDFFYYLRTKCYYCKYNVHKMTVVRWREMIGVIFMFCGCIISTAQQDMLRQINIPGSLESFQLVFIHGGSVTIGSKDYALSSFYMAQAETSYDQYILFQDRDFDSNEGALPNFDADAISRPSPPYEDFTKGMGKYGYPAVSMTQQAALRYCKWLYEKTGIFFRLPTEAEWQYACQLARNGEGTLGDYAWYFENAHERFQKIQSKKADKLGLFDLIGNVSEWTLDQYAEDFIPQEEENPWIMPVSRHSRTIKGGSYLTDAGSCSCELRIKSEAKWQRRDPQIPKSKWWNPDSPFVGFRVVVPYLQPSETEIHEFFTKAIVD